LCNARVRFSIPGDSSQNNHQWWEKHGNVAENRRDAATLSACLLFSWDIGPGYGTAAESILLEGHDLHGLHNCSPWCHRGERA
jgi:hypothetical protein